MPFGLTPGISLYLAAALLVAAYVRGYSGFGFSAIFIAAAALVTNPVPLVPVVFACEMLMTVFQARGIRGQIDWRRVGALLAGAAVVLPFSVWAILQTGESRVRLAVSLVVGIMALVLLAGWQLRSRIGDAGHTAVGALSGLFNAAGVGGLPVAAALTAQPIPPAVFRATMIVYLTGLDLITLPLMYAGGVVTGQTAIAAALAFPILGLGVWLGGRRFGAASPQGFRTFAIALLLILSGLGLIRTVL